jgi:hypothetical protein
VKQEIPLSLEIVMTALMREWEANPKVQKVLSDMRRHADELDAKDPTWRERNDPEAHEMMVNDIVALIDLTPPGWLTGEEE